MVENINIKINIKVILFYLLIILLLAADFKSSIKITYIVWIIALVFVIINIKKWKLEFNPDIIFIVIPAYLLSFIIITLSFVSGYGFQNVAQGVKILFLFGIFFPVILNSNFKAIDFYNGIIFSLAANSILLLIGKYLNLNILAWDTGNGRWCNIFNYPGSLYKAGIIALPYLLYELYIRFNFKAVLLLFLALQPIIFDGSRTGVLALIVIVLWVMTNIIIGILYKNDKNEIRRLFKYSIIIAVTVISLATLFRNDIINSGAYQRVSNMISELRESPIETSFYKIDDKRSSMIKTAVEQVEASPLIGKGFGTTRSSDMVIHNTYLQVFSDMGVFALILVLIIYFSFLKLFFRYAKDMLTGNSSMEKILFMGSAGSLLMFTFYGLFHPFSVEIGDWSIYIISYVILYKIVYGERGLAYD